MYARVRKQEKQQTFSDFKSEMDLLPQGKTAHMSCIAFPGTRKGTCKSCLGAIKFVTWQEWKMWGQR